MITFTKLRDGSWGVRGPLDEIAPGAAVTVTKRSGETSEEVVSEVVWENAEIAIARLAPRERQAQAAPNTAVGLDVPAGRYALALGGRNVTEFFKVDRPTDGRWAGWTFVKQIAGPNEHAVKGARKNEVLAAIAADPHAALLAYGVRTGHCGRCQIRLSDDVSRAMGIGPDCAEHVGIPRISRDEAVRILLARGEVPAEQPASPRVRAQDAQAGVEAAPVPQRAFIAPAASQQDELPGDTWEAIFGLSGE